MKEKFKVSGKRVEIPEAAAAQTAWKFTVRPGGWIIAESPDGKRERIAIHEARGKLGASLGGVLWQGEVARDQRGGGAGPGGGSDADLVAQFPGKVRKVLVAEGASVSEGEPLVLVEAMKMEFAIKAPYAGKVGRILVKEAQQLSPGERFVEMVPAGGEGTGAK